MRLAEEEVAASLERLVNAKVALKVKTLELKFSKEKLNHAESVVSLEEAKLAEAEGRAANPPLESSDLLKLEKTRLKAEGSEAKARGKVATAEMKLEKARR
jgi:hypothetical protein